MASLKANFSHTTISCTQYSFIFILHTLTPVFPSVPSVVTAVSKVPHRKSCWIKKSPLNGKVFHLKMEIFLNIIFLLSFNSRILQKIDLNFNFISFLEHKDHVYVSINLNLNLSINPPLSLPRFHQPGLKN